MALNQAIKSSWRGDREKCGCYSEYETSVGGLFGSRKRITEIGYKREETDYNFTNTVRLKCKSLFYVRVTGQDYWLNTLSDFSLSLVKGAALILEELAEQIQEVMSSLTCVPSEISWRNSWADREVAREIWFPYGILNKTQC